MSQIVSASSLAQNQDTAAANLTRTRYLGAWSPGAYSTGDLVTYQSKLYACIIPVSTGALSLIGSFGTVGSPGAGYNLTLPAGCQPGDLAVVAQVTVDSTAYAAIPVGNTLVVNQTATSPFSRLSLSWRMLSSADITAGIIAVPTQGSNGSLGLLHVYRHGVASPTIKAGTQTLATAPVTLTSSANFLYELCITRVNANTAFTQASLTGLASVEDSALNGIALGAGHESLGAGTTTSRTFANTAESATSFRQTYVLDINGTDFPIASFTEIGTDNPIIMNVNTVAASGATATIPDVLVDLVNAITLTANCTLTFPTAQAGKEFYVSLTQDATGSRTVTWPGTVKWQGGTAPTVTTTAGKTDVFKFICVDGTNWLGATLGLNY